MPNLAVIEEVRNGNELLYIGSRDGMEKKLVENAGVRYEGVSCGKLRRYFSVENFVDMFRVPIGLLQARRILKKFEPDVVFSKGGYVSVPVVMAARWLKIPVIVHESDISPGLANKICFKFAKKICVSFEETLAYLPKKLLKKVEYTGSPVREEILQGDAEVGYRLTGFDKHRPVILVIGGSQGAEQINELVRASLPELTKKFQIVHIVGKGNLDIGVNKHGYVQYEFLGRELADVYAISEMVVTRGGANAMAELALLKKKVLVIPLSGEASRGDQEENAHLFVRKFGWSMISGDVSREDFINNIELTFNNELSYNTKYKNGLKAIVSLILNYKK